MPSEKNQQHGPIQAGDIHSFGNMPIPKLTPELMSLVCTGDVFSLEQILEPGIPFWPGHPPVLIAPYMRHGDLPDLAPATVGNEIVNLPIHGGTHIDALAHIGKIKNGKAELYGGIPAETAMDNTGFTVHGAENFPPLILKGTLLDIAAAKNLDVLPDSYGITGEDIKACEKKQNVTVEKNTAVLIRTGFSRYWKVDNDRFSNKGAGLNIDGAHYLAERNIALVGADTEAVEQWPFDPQGPPLPVHTFLIVENGITHVESLYLDKLAAEKKYEFLFIALPLRIRGATGSHIHPIAIT
jgi:kynurenine formamidase